MKRDPALAASIFAAVGKKVEGSLGRSCLHNEEGARLLFEWLLKDHPSANHELESSALQLVARLQVMEAPWFYGMETFALGGAAVIGAQGGIVRGIPPLACIATGVTICFGGIIRDLLCQRPVAIGGQSYALATAAGASVYVALRELVVAGYPIPLPLRILLGGGTAIAQRIYVWNASGTDDTFLRPMANSIKVNRKASDGGATEVAEALCDASARGDVAALRQLVRERGIAIVNGGDYDKRTALHLAASEGHFETVRFLVDECGAEVNPIDRWGGSPLDDATRSKHALAAFFVDVVELGGRSPLYSCIGWRVRRDETIGAQDDAREGDANKLLVAFGTVRSGRSVGHVQSATMAGRTFLRRLALASSLGAGAFAASLLHRPTICEVALAARSSAPAMCAAATPARIIDGKAVAATIRSEVRDAAVELKEKNGVTPGLAVVLVGNRTDSKTYVRMKKRAADECGFFSVDRKFDESVTQNELVETVRALNADPQVHAILVQRVNGRSNITGECPSRICSCRWTRR